MSHNNHSPLAYQNKDAHISLREWLDITESWRDPPELPFVQRIGKFNVIRDDLSPSGTKGRAVEFLLREIKSKTLVYVAPRVGFAGISLAKVAIPQGRRVVLFAPACKEPSTHQRLAMELGAEIRWVRIAAMPVLNSYAAQWAASANDAFFIPLGLKHWSSTAALVRTAYELGRAEGEPVQAWCAISTGVLARSLAIAWPKTELHVVAVARNLKESEAGTRHIHSYPYPFASESRIMPPFNSIMTYDAKVWEVMQREAEDDAFMWNVAGEEKLKFSHDLSLGNSNRDWGDHHDLNLP